MNIAPLIKNTEVMPEMSRRLLDIYELKYG